MRTEDTLAAVGTGVWLWESASGNVTLDACAARLLGLHAPQGSPGTVEVGEAVVRGRVHVVDFVELEGIARIAVTEGALAEALLRVVSPQGEVARTVRVRLRPLGTEQVHVPSGPLDTPAPAESGTDIPLQVIGTVSEVPLPPPGATPQHTQSGGQAAGQAVTGDWRRSREAFLLDAGRALAEARSTSEVLRVVSSLSMPGFTPDGLGVFGVEGSRLSVIGHHGHAPGDEGPFLDMPLETDYPAAEVVRTGRAIYLPTPDDYRRRFPTAWPLAAPFGRQSWAFLPLIVAGRTIGAWLAAFAQPVAFTPDERSVLSTVARMLAQALSRAYVHESERELTDGLQRTMRPVHRPVIEGMRIAARYVPTGGGLQVGGDWYDVIPLPSGRSAIVIGDVQGHDVQAAGIMSQLRIALRAYATEGHHPDGVLSRASRFLGGLNSGSPDIEGRFATCLYMEVDPRTGTLDIARAGHPDPAIRLPDATMLVRPTAGGLPLGVDPDSDYPTTRIVLQPGETLLLCTDGLIETGGHDVISGWTRLREVFAAHPWPEGGLDELADVLVQAVHGPPSHHTTGPLTDRRDDDIALLLLSREGDHLGPDGEMALPPVRRTVLTVAQAEPDRIADARQQLRSLLHDWEDEDQAESAVLMLSEMLTNVLKHTDGDALMVAEISGEAGARLLHVDVADGSDELPHPRTPGELASSGRGLMLMESLAGAWGVDPRGDGKCIWFELHEVPVGEEAD